MKKIISMLAVIATPLVASAQDSHGSGIDKEIFNVIATISVIALVMVFILVVMRRLMDYRLKDKIIEKGIPEEIVASILQSNPKDNLNVNIKWFAILAGLGTGLTIIHYTFPLGVHSLAIMAFSIGVSFLGYFFFLKQSEK